METKENVPSVPYRLKLSGVDIRLYVVFLLKTKISRLNIYGRNFGNLNLKEYCLRMSLNKTSKRFFESIRNIEMSFGLD